MKLLLFIINTNKLDPKTNSLQTLCHSSFIQFKPNLNLSRCGWEQLLNTTWRFSAPTHLNIDDGNDGLGLVEMSSHPVHRLRDKIQHKIQIHLIFLVWRSERKKIYSRWKSFFKPPSVTVVLLQTCFSRSATPAQGAFFIGLFPLQTHIGQKVTWIYTNPLFLQLWLAIRNTNFDDNHHTFEKLNPVFTSEGHTLQTDWFTFLTSPLFQNSLIDCVTPVRFA